MTIDEFLSELAKMGREAGGRGYARMIFEVNERIFDHQGDAQPDPKLSVGISANVSCPNGRSATLDDFHGTVEDALANLREQIAKGGSDI